jgi:hypothetical protein
VDGVNGGLVTKCSDSDKEVTLGTIKGGRRVGRMHS